MIRSITLFRIFFVIVFIILAIIYFPQIQIDNSIERWIPPYSTGVTEYKEFLEQFGGDALIVVAFYHPDGFEQKEIREEMSIFMKKVRALLHVNNVFILPSPLFHWKKQSNEKNHSIAITFTPPSHLNPNRLYLLEAVEKLLDEIPIESHIAGTGVFHKSINEETKKATFLHFLIGLLLLFGLLLFILRKPMALLLVIGVSIGGVCTLLMCSAVLHIPLSMMNSILPVLILFYATSNALHILFHRGDFKKVLAPCIVATLTTCIGFLIFILDPIPLLRDFAILAILGLLGSLLWLFLFFFLSKFSFRPKKYFAKVFHRIPILSSTTILFISFIIVLFMLPGINNLRTDMFPLSFISSSNPRTLDYYFIERNVGNIIPMEYIVEIDRVRPESVKHWISSVLKLKEIGGVINYLDFPSFIDPYKYGYLSENGHLGRVTFFIPLLSSSKGILLSEEINKIAKENFIHYLPKVTGYITLFAYIADELGKSFTRSLILAFILVFIVIFIFLRDIKLFLLSLFPNIFPVLVILGLMGWLKIPLDIVTVPIGCFFLSIVVDDTIHFLYWYKKTKDLRMTIEESGPGIYLSTLVISTGFSVFLFSSSPPVRNFGILGIIAMVTALIGDVVLLPIMIKASNRD